MVAHPAGRRAAAAGGHFDFYGQLRHRLGALPVLVIHARAANLLGSWFNILFNCHSGDRKTLPHSGRVLGAYDTNSDYCEVLVRCCIHTKSLGEYFSLSGQPMPTLCLTGARVLLSCHFFISACPSAKEKPPAPL